MFKRNKEAPPRMAEQVAINAYEDQGWVRVQIQGENNFCRIIDVPFSEAESADTYDIIKKKVAEVITKEKQQ